VLAATSPSGPPNNPTAVGSACWLTEVDVAPGVAAFQIVTVSEFITAALAVPMVAARPMTTNPAALPSARLYFLILTSFKGRKARLAWLVASVVPLTLFYRRTLASQWVTVSGDKLWL
jgi:hypothetical protein